MRNLRPAFFFAFFAIAATLSFSENAVPAMSGLFEDGRLFFADAAGYHGIGTAAAAGQSEALRLAKADALKRIFSEIGRDEIFQEMCISAWPESIRTEEYHLTNGDDGMVTAASRILLDRNAVMLTDPSYRAASESLLNRSVELNGRIEAALTSAQKAEEAALLAEALTLYRQAEAGCAEVRALLRRMTDDSLLSDSGTSRLTILQVTEAMENTASAGLERIAAAEQALAVSDASRRMEASFSVIEEELRQVEDMTRDYLVLSPFYDLPKSRLEAIGIDLAEAVRKQTLLREKLSVMRGALDPGRVLLHEKITLALEDMDTVDAHLLKMQREARDEIRYPRLARQEDAYRRAEFRKKLIGTLGWFFLHSPGDFVSFRFDLPYVYRKGSGFFDGGETDFTLSLEGTFSSGFWVRARTRRDETLFFSGSSPAVNSAWTQEVALGFFQRSLFGMGFSWDWYRELRSSGESGSLPAESRLLLFLGGVDQDRMRPSALFSFAYTIPRDFSSFVFPYHVNGEATLVFRIENALILEAAVSSTSVLNTVAAESAALSDRLRYLLSLRAGAALRLPGPFAWGVQFRSSSESALTGGVLSGMSPFRSEWKGYIQYSF